VPGYGVTTPVNPLCIPQGIPWLVFNFQGIQPAVIQQEPKNDSQDGGDSAGPDDHAPDPVDNLFAFFLVKGIETTLLRVQAVGGVFPEHNPDADELGQGLAHGLHQKDGG
jgi:hypothetical protein